MPLLHVLLAAVALAGAVLLLVAELSPVYTVVVGSLQTPRRSVTAGANHGYALVILAACAVAMTAAAVRGRRTPAASLVALGAAALVIALAVDLPDTRASGRLPEAVEFSAAQAKAGRGFGLEIAGGVALIVAGVGLLAAGPVRRRPAPPRAGARPADVSDEPRS